MTKTTSKVVILNCDTQQEETRDMTKDELLEFQQLQDKDKAKEAEITAKANTKNALLNRLGISAEEAALLLG
jgi:hypothetical protein